MRKALTVIVALGMIIAFSGLTYAIHEGSDESPLPPKPAASAASIWKYISLYDSYTDWSRWPGTEKLYKGTQPHGAFLTTYVSDDARQIIKQKKGTFPDRSFVIKENYMPDKTLAAITVMYKIKGYNPEGGDWFWAKYKPDGSVEKEGKVAGCIKCHSAKADNDWVFTGSITDLPSADAEAVWEYISDTKKYTKWPRWPGTKKFYEGTEPHGMLLTTYVSKDAKKVIKKKQGMFSPGAFIVKENYKPDKTLAAITVMYKKTGFNPEAGDWFWAKYNPDGSTAAAGKVEGCIKCHSAKADNDWAFTGPIK